MRIFSPLSFTALLSLPLVGCGADLIGDWTGICEFTSMEIDVGISIEERDGKDYTGDAEIRIRLNSNPNDPDVFEGQLEGEKDKKDIDFELIVGDITDPEAVYRLDIVGELVEKDEIDATCNIGTDEGPIRLDYEG